MYYTKETRKNTKKENSFCLERGSRLCQRIEVVVADSDLVMTAAVSYY